ncbi:PEP-CTERM sorting domain-containing protein [Desulfobacula sp.]|uniref:PEP-CTERM sorting domain-containing protein n=1 Tax=Desulfobacula sp. TaxID=2593537 RepID=UPI0026053063|nr:PEP-CTERM sorting domain-containing protein [Desulfobacula sp.]
MKKSSIFLWVMILLFGAPVMSSATLVDYSNSTGHVVWDTESEQYWYWNVYDFSNKTWTDQVDAIYELNNQPYYGLNGWHMAGTVEMEQLWLNSASDVMQSFESIGVDVDWMTTKGLMVSVVYGRYDRVYVPINDEPAHFSSLAGLVEDGTMHKSELMHIFNYDTTAEDILGAWVTSTGPAPVPEPATMLLFGIGLLGVAGVSRRKN